MPKLNNHHISYDPEWKVEIYWTWHRALWAIQKAKATPERYMHLTNLLHAMTTEWNRMRMSLDVQGNKES